MTTRDPRNLDKRVNEERINESRPPLAFTDHSGFNVPAAVRERYPDLHFSYIAYECGGVDLVHDYDTAIERRGFEPALVSNFPELKRRHTITPFKDRTQDELVKHGGQVLMVRPKDVYKQECNFYNEKSRRDKYIADMYKGDPAAPRVIEDKRTWNPTQSEGW